MKYTIKETENGWFFYLIEEDLSYTLLHIYPSKQNYDFIKDQLPKDCLLLRNLKEVTKKNFLDKLKSISPSFEEIFN
jgi:hypothetical protein